MNVLVFNVGSTTLKYACIDSTTGARLTEGMFDRIGQKGGDSSDHTTAAKATLTLHERVPFHAIAHRVVQGAEKFCSPTIVSTQSLQELSSLDDLAPLHNPPARSVIDSLYLANHNVKHVMVFDSAFYATLPAKAYRYAIPHEIYERHHVRRYGAHGTSHQFVTQRCIDWFSQTLPERRASLKVISLHLGGGSSVTASVDGVAVETSMGMTPLEGLVMATRSGDIDPAIIFHLSRTASMSLDELDHLLNRQSGLKGLCGELDMRAILQRRMEGDSAARLAVEIYVHRIQKYIGAYLAILQGLDALVFTAGIGENAAVIRELICEPLGHLGIEINQQKNAGSREKGTIMDISSTESRIRTLVVPTDEEFAIAKQAAELLTDPGQD